MAVNSTAIWRVRPSGNNANGGGYDAGISSPGTDYSQQNAAHVTFNGSTITATTSGASATITITGYTVAITDIANALHITGGTNFTTGWYFIQSVNTGANTWTLDRNVATGAGAAMTGNMGGGWADFWTNTTSSGPLVAGNFVYILGSGVPNPASYTYDYTFTSFYTSQAGSSSAGPIVYAGDPNTPSFSSGGRPVVKCSSIIVWQSCSFISIQNLYFVASTGCRVVNAGSNIQIKYCIYDQFSFDGGLTGPSTGNSGNITAVYNEVFTSVAGAAGSTPAISAAGGSTFSFIIGNNIHDTIGPGITLNTPAANGSFMVADNIIAKTSGDAISLASFGSAANGYIRNNTIDGNAGNGITVATQFSLTALTIIGNLITNQTDAGKAGLNVSTGTAGANSLIAAFVDYNSFYNNTANYSGINASPHDVALGSNPYVAQSTENYALA